MTTKKGRMMYVPSDILEELNNIMVSDRLTIKSEAFRKLGYYAKEGRNIQQNIDCSKTKKNKQSNSSLYPGDFFNE